MKKGEVNSRTDQKSKGTAGEKSAHVSQLAADRRDD